MKPCRPLRQGDQMQCHCGFAWDVGEEKPKCKNDKPEIIEQLSLINPTSVIIQNMAHHEVTNSHCDNAPYHAFADHKCVHCGVTRPMMLNEDGTRSIFDDVDE